jgi:hypothetical protein
MSEPTDAADLEALEKSLPAAIAGARSLNEIESWLKSQHGVKSVQLAHYLSKSDPPQRDFIVELKTTDGSTVKRIVNVFDLGNEQFEFRQLRDK